MRANSRSNRGGNADVLGIGEEAFYPNDFSLTAEHVASDWLDDFVEGRPGEVRSKPMIIGQEIMLIKRHRHDARVYHHASYFGCRLTIYVLGAPFASTQEIVAPLP